MPNDYQQPDDQQPDDEFQKKLYQMGGVGDDQLPQQGGGDYRAAGGSTPYPDFAGGSSSSSGGGGDFAQSGGGGYGSQSGPDIYTEGGGYGSGGYGSTPYADFGMPKQLDTTQQDSEGPGGLSGRGNTPGWDGQEMHYGQAGPNETVIDSGVGEGAGTVNPSGPFDPFKQWGTTDRPINAAEAIANAGSGFLKGDNPKAPATPGAPTTSHQWRGARQQWGTTDRPINAAEAAAGGQQSGKDWFTNWSKGKPPNKETLLANADELKAHGYTLVPNKTLGPDGKPTNYDLQGPDGRMIDVIVGGSRGGEGWQYDDSGGGGAPGGGDASGGFGAGSGSFGNGAVGSAIERLLARGEKGVNKGDPNVAGPTAAFRAQAEHSTRRARNQLAERAAASGLNSGGAGSGAMDTGIQSQLEQEGRDVGSYQSNLMVDEIKQQRGDVINALQFAQGEERMALQHQLAMMNDQLQRAQMGQQNKQWYDQFTYGMGKDKALMDRDYLTGMMR